MWLAHEQLEKDKCRDKYIINNKTNLAAKYTKK